MEDVFLKICLSMVILIYIIYHFVFKAKKENSSEHTIINSNQENEKINCFYERKITVSSSVIDNGSKLIQNPKKEKGNNKVYSSTNERNTLINELFNHGMNKFYSESLIKKNNQNGRKNSISSEETKNTILFDYEESDDFTKSMYELEIKNLRNFFSKCIFLNIFLEKDCKKQIKDGNVNKSFSDKLKLIKRSKDNYSPKEFCKSVLLGMNNHFFEKTKLVIPSEESLVEAILLFIDNLNFISASWIVYLLIKFDYGLESEIFKIVNNKLKGFIDMEYPFVSSKTLSKSRNVKFIIKELEFDKEVESYSKDYKIFRRLIIT